MERMYFFDSTQDDQRIYQAADFARFHAQIIGNGVSNTANLPDLEVTAKTNRNVALGAGYMFANGYMYENDSTMTLTHAIADPTNDRMDRVVVVFDNNPAERRIYAYIKKGTPAAKPVPPSLQRDNYVHEMSVAQVRIIAGKSFVEQSEITDERTDDEVCGYIPLHNIYRGIQVDQLGIVNLPNNSYVDVKNDTPNATLDGTTRKEISLGNNIVVDKQNEMKGGYFVPKSDGVYMLWVMVRSEEEPLRDALGSDVQVYLNVNGEDTLFPILVNVINNHADNIWNGSAIVSLNAGDQVNLTGKVFHMVNPISLLNTWVRIAKIS